HPLKLKEIASEIGVTYATLWEYQKRGRGIPLQVLKNLCVLASLATGKSITHFSVRLQTKIQYLEYGAGPSKKTCKAVKLLDNNLAKIAGAHAADGHLRCRQTNRGERNVRRYEFVVRDGYRSNLEALVKWMKSAFSLQPKIRRESSSEGWNIYVSNKIIFRYLNQIFGFPTGRKHDIVKMPDIIANSSLDVQKSFCLGVFTFDGGVDHRTGYVNLQTKSYKLFKDINQVLRTVDIKPDYMSKRPDHYGRWTIRFRKTQKLRKCLTLFEPMTEKWERLKDHVFRPAGHAKNFRELVMKFKHAYPRTNAKSATFSDVLRVIHDLKRVTVRKASSAIDREYTVTYEYLKKLEDWRILSSVRSNTGTKIWQINSDAGQWRVPVRIVNK
ncbi:hypothetical protein AKJ42_01055, partial [candidate division MSBL1 archaeon SCGC-AAA261C02]